MWICEKCKTEIEDNFNECWNCYDDKVLLEDIENEAKEERKVINKDLSKNTGKYQETKWVCKKCNEENKDHSDICSNCGISFKEGFSKKLLTQKISRDKFLVSEVNKYRIFGIDILAILFGIIIFIVFGLLFIWFNLVIQLPEMYFNGVMIGLFLCSPILAQKIMTQYILRKKIKEFDSKQGVEYYDNGNVKLEKIPKDGNVIYKYYYKNGQVRSETIMQNGKRVGKLRKWDEQGNELESE